MLVWLRAQQALVSMAVAKRILDAVDAVDTASTWQRVTVQRAALEEAEE
jgi:hypothetical protein